MSLSLIADIGGTNARFALWNGQAPTAVEVLSPLDYATPSAAVHAYLDRVGGSVEALEAVCLACAGPVLGDHFRFTNNAWQLSRRDFCQEFGLKELVLVNDFAAQALAITRLGDDEKFLVRPGKAVSSDPILVLGPGTGLGVGSLLPLGNGHWKALPGEGGHVDLPVGNAYEIELWRILHRDIDYLDAERVLSGGGLLNLYAAICEIEGWTPWLETPKAISDAALAGDAQALAVIEQFCCCLGRVAGNGVLTMGARGGVYLAGGILPHFKDLLKASGFQDTFCAKGAMSNFVKDIPVWLITAERPGLLGAGVALQQYLETE